MHWPEPEQRPTGGPHGDGPYPSGPPAGGPRPGWARQAAPGGDQGGPWAGQPHAPSWSEQPGPPQQGGYPAQQGGYPDPYHAGPGAPVPGPRQEYLDAFDTADAGPDGPAGPGPDGPRHDDRFPDGAAESERPRPRPRTQPPSPPDPAAGEETDAEPGGGRSHPWGRTITGLVAVAVVVVLTFGVYGEVHEDVEATDGAAAPSGPPAGGADPAEDGDGNDEGGTPDGETGEEQPDHPDLSYEEAMDTVFDVDPELTGSGELAPVPGSDPAAFDDALTELRYRVDVEEGLGLDPEVFAEAVHTTLNDPRGWYNNGERSFSRVSSGEHDFVITLASPGTTHEWCGKADLDTEMDNVSCDSATTERVMINAWRWAQGSDTYGDDEIHAYRQMLINHEVGHRIGYSHAVCPAEGALAPVMMQQTKFLTTDGVTCVPNSWPHPGNG